MTSQRILKRFGKLTAIFGVAHWLLLVVSSALSLIGLRRLDNPELPVTTVERICGVIISVLDEPYETFRRIAGYPGGWRDLIAGVMNSFLWGAAVAAVLLLTRRRKLKMNQQGPDI
jgi:hypothetical protein